MNNVMVPSSFRYFQPISIGSNSVDNFVRSYPLIRKGLISPNFYL